jgi:predicted enzyme related to lactoylglutathione lyase
MVNYPPGTPSWVDYGSLDPDASASFYGELFGWSSESAGADAGGYQILTLGGERVGGLGPAPEGQPPHWTIYIAVADADETQAKVDAAGGKTLFGPLDVFTAGRMAMFADGADGAIFGIWQPGDNRGAQVVNQVNAFSWDELGTRDREGAERFYGEVFGWTLEPIEQGGEFVYGSWQLDGRKIGGLMPMGEQFPAHTPAHWLPYFGVEDVNATAARAEELGGGVRVPRMEVPAGAFSVLSDPHGAVFGILQGSYDPPPGG